MKEVDQVAMRFGIQKAALCICIVLLIFKGVPFLWGFLYSTYDGFWKPGFLKIINLPIHKWLLYVAIIQFSLLLCGVMCFCIHLFMVIKALFLLRKREINALNHDNALFSLSDAPIKKAADDEFGREAYVRMLMSLIITSPNRRDARYIGVYGRWGDGKTSVWNLLKEQINCYDKGNRPICVEFSPWKYPESANIQMIFFERLSLAVAEKGYGKLAKISSLLAKRFAVSRINQSIGAINDLIDWLRKLLFSTFLSEDSLTEELRSLLSPMKQKVIVVVDDLDRLSKEEICRVIRFIKANGDLPNITYLILADEDHLANAVAGLVAQPDKKDIVNGREYLKKIIPLRCPLPSIKGSRLLDSFKQHLSVLLTEYDLESENPKDTCDWLLKKYMHNARTGKEILNAFSIKLATYKRQFAGRKYFGVHIGDLLVLTIIEIYEPDIYNELWGMFMKFLDDPLQGLEWDKGISEQWMEEHIFKHACGSREIIEQFLSERLGVSKSGGETPDAKPVVYKLDNPKAPELMLHYRLASQYCFRLYFILEEEPGHLSQDEQERFLQEIRKERIPEEQILKLDESGLLPQLLYALEGQKTMDTKTMSDCYIKTLIFMANSSLKNLSFNSGGPYYIPQSIYVGIYRCLIFYCQDIKAHWMNGEKVYGSIMQRIGDMIMPIFSSENDVILTAKLIASDFKYHRASDPELSYDTIFSQKDYDKLCKMYLERIEHFQREGSLVRHVEFFELFRCWRILLRESNDPSLKERFKEACQPMTKDVQAINSMIIFFCSDNREAVNPPCLIVTIQLDDLRDAFGEEGVQTILATLNAADKLPEYTCKAWVSLRWALENKEDNVALNEEEKMNCLKDLYEKEPYKSEMAEKTVEREPV